LQIFAESRAEWHLSGIAGTKQSQSDSQSGFVELFLVRKVGCESPEGVRSFDLKGPKQDIFNIFPEELLAATSMPWNIWNRKRPYFSHFPCPAANFQPHLRLYDFSSSAKIHGKWQHSRKGMESHHAEVA